MTPCADRVSHFMGTQVRQGPPLFTSHSTHPPQAFCLVCCTPSVCEADSVLLLLLLLGLLLGLLLLSWKPHIHEWKSFLGHGRG